MQAQSLSVSEIKASGQCPLHRSEASPGIFDSPNCTNIKDQTDNKIPFVINGCTVSFTSSDKSTADSLKAVKEILMSAYRTRITNL
jgi:hypothetical protein